MKSTHRLLSAVLTLCLLLAVLPLPAAAVTFSDIKGHWAESYICKAVEHGYVSGYDDGTFRPGTAITRAEFCKMLNGALQLSATASISFSDVPASKWYYKDIQKATAAGYISGYDNGTFLGDNQITRQEAAVVIARLIADPTSLKDLSGLADGASVASWAKQGVQNVYSKGYMAGDNLKKFNPKGNLTRAEAVKIIESLLTGESLVTSNVTVSESGQSYSNKVFTGNVIISAGVGSGSVTFKNCRILGTLLVNGGGSAGIRLSNTGVANLTVNSQTSVGVAAVGSSTVRSAYLSTPCALTESQLTGMGQGFQSVTLGGTGLTSAACSLSGDYDSITLGAPSSLTLNSGTVQALTVSAQASGSEITLLSGVQVKTATINAACDFFGAGTIQQAVKNADGVTFETAPGTITGQNPSTQTLSVTSIPKDGAVRVPTDTQIVLTFDDVIRKADGTALTTSYVQNSVILRRGSASGTKVSLSPSISQSGKVLTLTPSGGLTAGESYYLTVTAGAFQGESGGLNKALSAVFQTEGTADSEETLTAVFYPGDGTGNIPVLPSLTLTFDEKVFQSSGAAVTGAYIESDAVELRRGSRTGAKTAFTASVNSAKKILTITPDDDLQTDTVYYLILKEGALTNAAGESCAQQSWSFETAASAYAVPMAYPASGTEDIPTDTAFSFVFDAAMYNGSGGSLTASYLEKSVFTLRRGSRTGTKISFTASRSSDGRTLTVTPDDELEPGTIYYLTIAEDSMLDAYYDPVPALTYLYRTADEESGGSLTTGDLAPYDTYPQQGDTGVAADTRILLGFDEALLQPDGSKMTAACLQDSVVELRRGSQSGTKVEFTAALSLSREIVTLTPAKDLTEGYTYYVILKAGTFCTADGTLNEKYVLSFTVGDDSHLSLEIEPGRTTAELTVDYDFRGLSDDAALKITYTKKGGSAKTFIDLYSPGSKSGSETFTLRGLTENASYTVKATLTLDDGETLTATGSFTTSDESSDATLQSLRIYTAGGGSYRAVFTKTGTNRYDAEISGAVAPVSRKVEIVPVASDKYAWIEVDGQAVDSGDSCFVTASTKRDYVEVTITVEAQDGTVATYDLTVPLDWDNAE
ncbi:MAG: Ig-like domain-containing protein [Butyricicoccaceae bacterium]